MARIDSVFWVVDGWVQDSVKSIGFARVSNQEIVEAPINDLKLELYKNHGIRKGFDFARFPLQYQELYRLDPNVININSVPYNANGDPVIGMFGPEPTVGDIYVKRRSFGSYSPSQGQNSISWIDTSKAITGLSIVGATDDIEVVMAVTTISDSYLDTIIYTINTNSDFKPFLSRDFGDSTYFLMPRELGAAYTYEADHGSCSPYLWYNGCNPIIPPSYLHIDSCMGPLIFECFYQKERHFRPYLGFVSFREQTLDEGSWVYYVNGRHYSYLKLGKMECGVFHHVGIDSQSNTSSIQFLPNPASESFHLYSDVIVEQLAVYDSEGRKVWAMTNPISNQVINCSQWPNGLYVVQTTSNGLIQTQKLVVSH